MRNQHKNGEKHREVEGEKDGEKCAEVDEGTVEVQLCRTALLSPLLQDTVVVVERHVTEEKTAYTSEPEGQPQGERRRQGGTSGGGTGKSRLIT